MEASVKNREDRARRALANRGYVLRKTPARSWLRQHYEPGYVIVDQWTNTAVSGCCEREYEGHARRGRVLRLRSSEGRVRILEQIREAGWSPLACPAALACSMVLGTILAIQRWLSRPIGKTNYWNGLTAHRRGR
jgi:hypothetical protein